MKWRKYPRSFNPTCRSTRKLSDSTSDCHGIYRIPNKNRSEPNRIASDSEPDYVGKDPIDSCRICLSDTAVTGKIHWQKNMGNNTVPTWYCRIPSEINWICFDFRGFNQDFARISFKISPNFLKFGKASFDTHQDYSELADVSQKFIQLSSRFYYSQTTIHSNFSRIHAHLQKLFSRTC
jgi:hypothetical protein